jgi:hypothetical protein
VINSTIKRQTRERQRFERIAAAKPKSTNWIDAVSTSIFLELMQFVAGGALNAGTAPLARSFTSGLKIVACSPAGHQRV